MMQAFGDCGERLCTRRQHLPSDSLNLQAAAIKADQANKTNGVAEASNPPEVSARPTEAGKKVAARTPNRTTHFEGGGNGDEADGTQRAGDSSRSSSSSGADLSTTLSCIKWRHQPVVLPQQLAAGFVCMWLVERVDLAGDPCFPQVDRALRVIRSLAGRWAPRNTAAPPLGTKRAGVSHPRPRMSMSACLQPLSIAKQSIGWLVAFSKRRVAPCNHDRGIALSCHRATRRSGGGARGCLHAGVCHTPAAANASHPRAEEQEGEGLMLRVAGLYVLACQRPFGCGGSGGSLVVWEVCGADACN
jgi:hypothetical protein